MKAEALKHRDAAMIAKWVGARGSPKVGSLTGSRNGVHTTFHLSGPISSTWSHDDLLIWVIGMAGCDGSGRIECYPRDRSRKPRADVLVPLGSSGLTYWLGCVASFHQIHDRITA